MMKIANDRTTRELLENSVELNLIGIEFVMVCVCVRVIGKKPLDIFCSVFQLKIHHWQLPPPFVFNLYDKYTFPNEKKTRFDFIWLSCLTAKMNLKNICVNYRIERIRFLELLFLLFLPFNSFLLIAIIRSFIQFFHSFEFFFSSKFHSIESLCCSLISTL